jgi:hypothetical protein
MEVCGCQHILEQAIPDEIKLDPRWLYDLI